MTSPGAASDDDDDAGAGLHSQRVDRWLWYVRAVKSRTLAAGLVTEGRVRINRLKASKPSQTIKIGDVLTITVGPRVRVLKVVAFGVRRGPPSEAQALYEDLTPPPEPRPDLPPPSPAGGLRDLGSGRPTKRDRRLLDRLRQGDLED